MLAEFGVDSCTLRQKRSVARPFRVSGNRQPNACKLVTDTDSSLKSKAWRPKPKSAQRALIRPFDAERRIPLPEIISKRLPISQPDSVAFGEFGIGNLARRLAQIIGPFVRLCDDLESGSRHRLSDAPKLKLDTEEGVVIDGIAVKPIDGGAMLRPKIFGDPYYAGLRTLPCEIGQKLP
jgi:hypothetical protein